ncbi:unnamed protein product [Diplocarpon coronariae]
MARSGRRSIRVAGHGPRRVGIRLNIRSSPAEAPIRLDIRSTPAEAPEIRPTLQTGPRRGNWTTRGQTLAQQGHKSLSVRRRPREKDAARRHDSCCGCVDATAGRRRKPDAPGGITSLDATRQEQQPARATALIPHLHLPAFLSKTLHQDQPLRAVENFSRSPPSAGLGLSFFNRHPSPQSTPFASLTSSTASAKPNHHRIVNDFRLAPRGFTRPAPRIACLGSRGPTMTAEWRMQGILCTDRIDRGALRNFVARFHRPALVVRTARSLRPLQKKKHELSPRLPPGTTRSRGLAPKPRVPRMHDHERRLQIPRNTSPPAKGPEYERATPPVLPTYLHHASSTRLFCWPCTTADGRLLPLTPVGCGTSIKLRERRFVTRMPFGELNFDGLRPMLKYVGFPGAGASLSSDLRFSLHCASALGLFLGNNTLFSPHVQQHVTPSRALSVARRESQPDNTLGFSDRMARAKAAMLAREQQHKLTVSIPAIVITPSLNPSLQSDDAKH